MEEPIKDAKEAVRLTTTHVYNTIDKLKFDIDDLSVGMEAKEQYAVGQTAEPKRDMAVIIKQLVHQVLTLRHHMVQTRDYMRENREWLTARDWTPVRLKLDFTVRTLLDVRCRLKPSYPEGEVW